MKRLTYIWLAEDAGQRADKVLAVRLGYTRSRLQQLTRQGAVSVNGQAHDLRGNLRTGDRVEVAEPDPLPDEIMAENIPLEILFEDSQVIVLNKPADLVVHPGAGNREGTLVSALLHHCRGTLSGIGGVERPGIVHRLDKDTSGVLVAAKTDAAHQSLAGQFKGRSIEKYYQAFVRLGPKGEAGSWTDAIGRHRVQRQKMSVRRSGGREARTDYKTLQRWPTASLLELRIFTGRTHQIRVHCAAAGCPVLGDAVYGRPGSLEKEAGIARQLLHAARLVFAHPVDGRRMDFKAPLPADFSKLKRYLDGQ